MGKRKTQCARELSANDGCQTGEDALGSPALHV